MDSKDKFNAEKWESIDEVTPLSVPKYEFENSVGEQPNSFSADQWYVENEENIEPNVYKHNEQITKPEHMDGRTTAQQTMSTNQPSEHNSGKNSYKLVKILVAAVLIIAIIGGLGYYMLADTIRLNQVCKYIESNDYESASASLSQMKPSLETVAVENLIEYAKAFHNAEEALNSLNITNLNENLEKIDTLKNSYSTYTSEEKVEFLPERVRYVYDSLNDEYETTFSSIETDSINQYFELDTSWSDLIETVKNFELNYEFYEKDENGYYSDLEISLSAFNKDYNSFDDYEKIPQKYQLEYNKISNKVTKLDEYDFDYLGDLFTDSQSSIIYYYRHWTDKSFRYSINKMQNYVDDAETSCNELKDELTNMFSSFDNSPSYIWNFVSDCESEYESLQSDINIDKKNFSNSEELHSLDYDKNYTTTDYFVGFYDTKNTTETRKNAEIAVNILKAYLLVGDELSL